MKTLRGPLLRAGLITGLLVVVAVAFGAFSSDDTSGESLQPLGPRGAEQIVIGLSIVVVFAIVFGLVLLSTWLRSSPGRTAKV